MGLLPLYQIVSILSYKKDLLRIIKNNWFYSLNEGEEESSGKKAVFFVDIHLHSVFIDCILQTYGEANCQKRQEESDGYCDDSYNIELEYNPDPLIKTCGT